MPASRGEEGAGADRPAAKPLACASTREPRAHAHQVTVAAGGASHIQALRLLGPEEPQEVMLMQLRFFPLVYALIFNFLRLFF